MSGTVRRSSWRFVVCESAPRDYAYFRNFRLWARSLSSARQIHRHFTGHHALEDSLHPALEDSLQLGIRLSSTSRDLISKALRERPSTRSVSVCACKYK